jgi:hypothetical protein
MVMVPQQIFPQMVSQMMVEVVVVVVEYILN